MSFFNFRANPQEDMSSREALVVKNSKNKASLTENQITRYPDLSQVQRTF